MNKDWTFIESDGNDYDMWTHKEAKDIEIVKYAENEYAIYTNGFVSEIIKNLEEAIVYAEEMIEEGEDEVYFCEKTHIYEDGKSKRKPTLTKTKIIDTIKIMLSTRGINVSEKDLEQESINYTLFAYDQHLFGDLMSLEKFIEEDLFGYLIEEKK